MKIFLSFLILLFISPLFQGSETEWSLKKDKDGIQVYTRKPAGSKLLDLKIKMQVESSLNELMAALDDVESHKKWVFRCSESRIIEKIDQNGYYYYVKMNFPIPAKDRDVVIQYQWEQDPGTKIIRTHSKGAPGKLKEREDAIRIIDFKSSYLIVPETNGTIEIEYFLHADPAGYLPAWMVNMGVSRGPLKTMQKLKERLAAGLYKGARKEGIAELK